MYYFGEKGEKTFLISHAVECSHYSSKKLADQSVNRYFIDSRVNYLKRPRMLDTILY